MGTLSQGERRKQAEVGGKCRGLGHCGAQKMPLIASDKHNAVTLRTHFMGINRGTENKNLRFTEMEKSLFEWFKIHTSQQNLAVHFTKNQWHLFKFTAQLKFFFLMLLFFFFSHKLSDQRIQTECFYDSHKPCFYFYRCSGTYQTMASWVGSIVSFEK